MDISLLLEQTILDPGVARELKMERMNSVKAFSNRFKSGSHTQLGEGLSTTDIIWGEADSLGLVQAAWQYLLALLMSTSISFEFSSLLSFCILKYAAELYYKPSYFRGDI